MPHSDSRALPTKRPDRLFGGPAQWLMGFFVTTFGDYLWNVIPMGFRTFNEGGDAAWQGGWTIFYWGWWISWAPFVGMFIARVSRGRTVREFITCVLIIPSLVCVLWMAVFGDVGVAFLAILNSGRAIYKGGRQS